MPWRSPLKTGRDEHEGGVSWVGEIFFFFAMEKEKRAQTAGGSLGKDVVRLKGGCVGAQVRRASLMELLTHIRAAASRWKTLGCHLEFFIATFFLFFNIPWTPLIRNTKL